MTNPQNNPFQLVTGNRGAETPGRRAPSRPSRGPAPQGPTQENVWKEVDKIGQGWKFLEYLSLDRTVVRSVQSEYGQLITTNGGQFVVLKHSGTTDVKVVVAEHDKPDALTVNIVGPSLQPHLVAARALEYRMIATEYFQKTGKYNVAPPPHYLTEGAYLKAMHHKIDYMSQELTKLDTNPLYSSKNTEFVANIFPDVSSVVAMSSGIALSNLVVAMGEFSSGLPLTNVVSSRALGGNSPIIA